MAIKTLGDLKTEIYQRSDTSNNYIDGYEMRDLINGSIAELYDVLVSVNKDFYLADNVYAVVSGTDTYPLPSDFYKCMGVDVEDGSGTYSMPRFNFAERNMYSVSNADKSITRYRIMGSNIRLSPNPNWSGDMTLWYIPLPPELELDSDAFDGMAGYSEYVILDCIIKIRAKREEDASIEVAQKRLVYSRINNTANDRDDANPDRVRDVYAENWNDNILLY